MSPLACPLSLVVQTAAAVFLAASPLLLTESTDPVPPTKPLGMAELSDEQALQEKGADRDVARAVKELQKQLGGPIAERSDALKPYPQNQQPRPSTRQPGHYGPAPRPAPGHHAPRRPTPAPGTSVPRYYPPGQPHPPIPAHGGGTQPFYPPGEPHPIPPRTAPGPAAPGHHDKPDSPGCRHFRPDFRLGRPGSGKTVELLRLTAGELDRAASRLEWENLYAQADALRELAQDLRLEARKRQNSKSRVQHKPQKEKRIR